MTNEPAKSRAVRVANEKTKTVILTNGGEEWGTLMCVKFASLTGLCDD